MTVPFKQLLVAEIRRGIPSGTVFDSFIQLACALAHDQALHADLLLHHDRDTS